MRYRNGCYRGYIDLLIIPRLLIESIFIDGPSAILIIVICQKARAGVDFAIS